MSRSVTSRRVAAAATSLALLLGLAACSLGDGGDDLVLGEDETTAPDDGGTTSPPQPVTCDDPLQSYAPEGTVEELVDGPTVEEIRERGVLVVGVSADTLLMSARNPFTGRIEGFDVDMLREVARAIFGDPDKLRFRVITSAERIGVLENGDVDLVARTFTINCDRWDRIAFSAEYYRAGQKVLVAEGSEATSLADLEALGDQRVCAPASTTTLTRLEEYPGIEAVAAPTHSQCLALFQQGQVDAITGDDTILAGFAAQDPYAVVVGDPISEEPYGIGAPADAVDLVQLVNAVLERMIADGTWTEIYDRWLGAALGEAPTPPAPVYGRIS